MARRRRQRGYKFTEKTHSKRGFAAMILAILLLVMYGVFIYLSFCRAGRLSVYYGSAGVLAVIVALMDTILAITSLQEEDSFMLFPRIGLLLALISLVVWGGTYVIGLGIL